MERPFAHRYETGDLHRAWGRLRDNVCKRVLIQAAGYNIELLLRSLTGVGTPRSLWGRVIVRYPNRGVAFQIERALKMWIP